MSRGRTLCWCFLTGRPVDRLCSPPTGPAQPSATCAEQKVPSVRINIRKKSQGVYTCHGFTRKRSFLTNLIQNAYVTNQTDVQATCYSIRLCSRETLMLTTLSKYLVKITNRPSNLDRNLIKAGNRKVINGN